LKLEHVYWFDVEIKVAIPFHLVNLFFSLFFEFFVFFGAFIDELVNVNFTQKVNFINFLFHDGSCSVNEHFFILFFWQVFILGLVSLLNDNGI
jgi:hypothetical protein